MRAGLSAQQLSAKYGKAVSSIQNAKKALKLTGITPPGPSRQTAEQLFNEVDQLLAPNPTRAYPDDPAMEIQKAGEELVKLKAEMKGLEARLSTLGVREAELNQLVRMALEQLEDR